MAAERPVRKTLGDEGLVASADDIPGYLKDNDDDMDDHLSRQFELQRLDYPGYVIVGEPEVLDVAKRFVGGLRDGNWKLSQKQQGIGKRFFGRWMNRNYLLAKLQAQRQQGVDKRFFGRWRNYNYLMEKLNKG